MSESARDKFYNRTEGVLYISGNETDLTLVDDCFDSGLTVVAHVVDRDPFLPRLETRRIRKVGVNAIREYLESRLAAA